MNKFAIEIKWGIFFSLASLIWMILEHTVGLHDVYISKQPVYTNLFAIVAIALYAVALRDKKANYFNGEMTWKQGFISGVVLSIVICVISPLVQFVSYVYISPQFFDNIIKYSVQNKVQTQEQAVDYFNLNNFVVQGIYGSLSMGVITSAVVAEFVKTRKSKK